MTSPPPSPKQRRELRELEAQIEATPSHARIKGMYVRTFLTMLEQRRLPAPTTERYMVFKDYPLRDYMRMLLDACPAVYPDCSLREALKRQGRLVYPTLASSTVGKVIFAMAGSDWNAALPLASRGWEISLTPGSATLVDRTKTSAVLALRDIYNFPDTLQVGIIEGAMELFHVEGTVVAEPKGRICDVDLRINWAR